MDALPAELLYNIIEYLDCQTITAVALTNKKYYQISNDKYVWIRLLKRDFGEFDIDDLDDLIEAYKVQKFERPDSHLYLSAEGRLYRAIRDKDIESVKMLSNLIGNRSYNIIYNVAWNFGFIDALIYAYEHLGISYEGDFIGVMGDIERIREVTKPNAYWIAGISIGAAYNDQIEMIKYLFQNFTDDLIEKYVAKYAAFRLSKNVMSYLSETIDNHRIRDSYLDGLLIGGHYDEYIKYRGTGDHHSVDYCAETYITSGPCDIKGLKYLLARSPNIANYLIFDAVRHFNFPALKLLYNLSDDNSRESALKEAILANNYYFASYLIYKGTNVHRSIDLICDSGYSEIPEFTSNDHSKMLTLLSKHSSTEKVRQLVTYIDSLKTIVQP